MDKDEENWRDAWKAFFKPQRCGLFAIVPTWDREFSPREGETIISLDPGRAFGTGGHASTRLCLCALGRLPAAPTILDVGCGSGILGIGCALRWPAARVVAVDLDLEAIEVTNENAALNGVAARVTASTTPLAQIPERFAVVVANIQADVLIAMSAELARHVGSALVLSGILVEQADSVAAAFVARDMRLADKLLEDGWCALVLEPDW